MKSLAFLIVPLILLGCATPYQANSYLGGYSDAQLGTNVFQIRFQANGYTTLEKASDLALLHAADVTLQHGFRYFVIKNEAGRLDHHKNKAPSSAYDALVTKEDSGTGWSTTQYTITCYGSRPNSDLTVYDAKDVDRAIRTRYGIN